MINITTAGYLILAILSTSAIIYVLQNSVAEKIRNSKFWFPILIGNLFLLNIAFVAWSKLF